MGTRQNDPANRNGGGASFGFVAKIREQIGLLRCEGYSYTELRVYVSGIADPWVFGADDEFEFDGEAVLVVRMARRQNRRTKGCPSMPSR